MTFQYNAYLRSEEDLYDDPTQLSEELIAVLEEDIDELNRLKSIEFVFNTSDRYGNTPLHVAVIKNKSKSVEYLVDVDAVSLEAKNSVGQTPLFNASRFDKFEIAVKLIEAGACVNVSDNQNNTPLHVSVCNPRIAHFLIRNGAEIGAVNFYNDTPLHNAVTVENLETVCMLLYYNCDATVRNSEGNTPFMDALIYENLEIQDTLFEYTDDYNVCSTDGDTILTLALTYQSPYVEEILARGAKVNRRALESSLMTDKCTIFETVWKKLPTRELENSNLLDKLAYGMRRNSILNYIGIILENSDDCTLEALANCFNDQLSFADFVERCARNRGLEELTKMTCVLLEYNCRFALSTVFQIYIHFGYCELFKLFLYMDYNIDNQQLSSSLGWIVPKYIYDVNTDIRSVCRDSCFYFMNDGAHIKSAVRSLEYSVDAALVKLLTENLSDDTGFVEVCGRVPKVPSLLQLARDEARKYIVDAFGFIRPSQYYTFVSKIDIATVYKRILTLEKRIYDFDIG